MNPAIMNDAQVALQLRRIAYDVAVNSTADAEWLNEAAKRLDSKPVKLTAASVTVANGTVRTVRVGDLPDVWVDELHQRVTVTVLALEQRDGAVYARISDGTYIDGELTTSALIY
jgi:hypothetical protein